MSDREYTATAPTTEDDAGVWAWRVCDHWETPGDLAEGECHDCHDGEYRSDDHELVEGVYCGTNRWFYGEPDIGDSCAHCCVRIVDVADEQMRLDDVARDEAE